MRRFATALQSYPSTYRIGTDQAYLLAAAASFASYVLEGPLRYGLQLASAPSLLYARDLVAVTAVVLAVGSWINGQRSAIAVVAVTAVLLAHTLVALISLPAAFQALFGFKQFLPFLLGCTVAPVVARNPAKLIWFAGLMFATTAIGVQVNRVFTYPWIGMEYETAFGTVSAAKQWWIDGGITRLPGFARASYTASAIIVLSFVPLLASRIHFSVRLALAGLCAWIVILTTSKAPLLALGALLFDAFIVYGLGLRGLADLLLIALAFVGLALPVIAVQLGSSSQNIPTVLLSFMERVLEMWPQAFELFDHPGQVIIGRGLGGIGTSQLYGEPSRFNSADNIMIFLFVSFGLCAVGYIAVFLVRLLGYLQKLSSTDTMFRCVRGWTVVVLTNGLTSSMVEDPSANLILGFVVGIAFYPLSSMRRDVRPINVTRESAPA